MLLLGIPFIPSANAGSACNFDDTSGQLSFNMTLAQEPDDGTVIARDPATGEILIYESLQRGDRVSCLGTTPTVENVDKIILSTGLSGPSDFWRVSIDLSGGAFAPGKSNEPGTSDEIEFEINLPARFSNHFQIVGGTAGDRITFGTNGVNLNSDESTGIDRDITLGDPPDFGTYLVIGSAGSDVLSTAGKRGTGDLWPSQMNFYMGEGEDRYNAGEGFHFLLGGPGQDKINFANVPPDTEGFGLNVDLGDPGIQADGSFQKIEHIVGSRGHDYFTGNGRPNRLSAGRGSDILEGEGGDDRLDGGRGNTDDCVGGPGQDVFIRCEVETN
jgi:Ca2+-binding RTX toxin-like protein